MFRDSDYDHPIFYNGKRTVEDWKQFINHLLPSYNVNNNDRNKNRTKENRFKEKTDIWEHVTIDENNNYYQRDDL